MKKRFDVRRGRTEPTREQLNKTIEEIGITKKELTEMLGISVNTMTNWISGTHPIPFVYQVVLELMAEDVVTIPKKAFLDLKELVDCGIDDCDCERFEGILNPLMAEENNHVRKSTPS